MKNIALAGTRYGITGIASVDIMAPHCAVALFTLTRGCMVVWINGERSGRSSHQRQPDGHVEFAHRRGLLRRSGPTMLRHINS